MYHSQNEYLPGLDLGSHMVLFYIFHMEQILTVLQESMPWFNIIGVGYVKLLQMIVMPFSVYFNSCGIYESDNW